MYNADSLVEVVVRLGSVIDKKKHENIFQIFTILLVRNLRLPENIRILEPIRENPSSLMCTRIEFV